MKKNIKKIGILLLALVLSIGLFAGCTVQDEPKDDTEKQNQENQNVNQEAFPMEVEDAFGYKTTIEEQPERIISLAPNFTEILFALELDDKVVGVDSYSDYPEAAKEKEVVGDVMTINVEKIIELDPDLVFYYGPGNEETNKELRNAGINLLCYEPESIDEVIKLIENMGTITGSSETAKNVTENMRNKRDSIIEKVSGSEKVKVFYEVWHEPLMAAGPGSFLDEFINLAGGENIAGDAEGAYPEFDLEQLIERNPDVYLTSQDMPDKTVESIKARSGYDAINAVKNDRIYILEPNIISRPGPRIVEGLELVAKSIHPELFK